jgi:hypothetical protein
MKVWWIIGIVVAMIVGIGFIMQSGERSEESQEAPSVAIEVVEEVNSDPEVDGASSDGTTVEEIVRETPEVASPKLVNGKTLNERLEDAARNIHGVGSEQKVRDDFPDLELIYTDDGKEDGFPSEILPFDYYYSAEADKTFNFCGIKRTIFICDGRVNSKISDDDLYDPSKCTVTNVYTDYLK